MQQNTLRRYAVEAILRPGDKGFFKFEKEVFFRSIKLSPIMSENGFPLTKIKATMEVEANDENEALEKYRFALEDFAILACCTENIALSIENISARTLPKVTRMDNGSAKIELTESIRVSAEIAAVSNLDAKVLKQMDVVSNALNKLVRDEKERIRLVIEWYKKGMMEVESIDRFICFWVAVDAWGAFIAPQYNHRKRMMNVLEKYGYGGDKNEIYATRCDLFHEGKKQKIENHLPNLERFSYNIVQKIKDELLKGTPNFEPIKKEI